MHHWYWSPHRDDLFYGPHETRDEAMAAGVAERGDRKFYVATATNPPIRLADWIGAEDALETAEERIYDSDRVSAEYDDSVFEATPAQRADLERRLKQACDEWQAAHDLEFTCNTFEAISSPEWLGEELA